MCLHCGPPTGHFAPIRVWLRRVWPELYNVSSSLFLCLSYPVLWSDNETVGDLQTFRATTLTPTKRLEENVYCRFFSYTLLLLNTPHKSISWSPVGVPTHRLETTIPATKWVAVSPRRGPTEREQLNVNLIQRDIAIIRQNLASKLSFLLMSSRALKAANWQLWISNKITHSPSSGWMLR